MLAAIVRSFAGNPRIVTALVASLAVFGRGPRRCLRASMYSRISLLTRAGCKQRRPGTRCDPSRSTGHRPLETTGRYGKREDREGRRRARVLSAIQVVFDRGGDPYRQRQVVLSDWPSRGHAAAGCRGSAAVTLSSRWIPGALRLHSDPAFAGRVAYVVQWIVKPQILAVPGVPGANLRGRKCTSARMI